MLRLKKFMLVLCIGLSSQMLWAEEDLRAFQHGIKFIQLTPESYYLIWSSAGIPPTYAGGSWTHDVYYSVIQVSNPVIKPVKIISAPEAQEPASAAINESGNIMITMEDGWDADRTISQRFGVYDRHMQPVRAYPQMVYDGGHSGHVAAAGEKFVVFFSNEWISHGGVDNLGSGDDVLVKIYHANGWFEKKIDIAVGGETRDWWPIVAASENRALLLWQRFLPEQTFANLYYALLDVESGRLIQMPSILEKGVKYYTYNISYLKKIKRFLVTGSYKKGGGFAFLLDNQGQLIDSYQKLPGTVREAELIARYDPARQSMLVVQPRSQTGLILLNITRDTIKLSTELEGDYHWQYMGTDGVFIDNNTVFIVSLSAKGLITKKYRLNWVSKGK